MTPKRSLFQLSAALEGVAIVGVLPGSPSARAGIRYGDVLLEVNGQRVRCFEDYVAAKAMRDDGMDVVVFRSGAERIERLRYERREHVNLHEILTQLIEGRIGIAGEPSGDQGPPS